MLASIRADAEDNQPAAGADQPLWGAYPSRNMVSPERGLPADFDPATGRNILWSAEMGTQCYSSPVVGSGHVLIGMNNAVPRDPRHQGDRGVLACFRESDGAFVWQLVVPKLEGDVYLDWPNAGMCSPATVEGDRVYMVTNRNEVVCLDLAGMANGNDGPYVDEGRHMSPGDQPPMEPGSLDADILWLFDLRAECGVRPHDSAHASILIDGPYLYLNTSNGLNSKHDGVEKPKAPSLVVLDKATGRLVAQDAEGIGPRIFHCTWSSPALAEVAGRRLVCFGGGDGVCYAFAALGGAPPATGTPQSLARVWRFDCDPTGPKEDVHRFIRNRKESPSTIMSMPVFHEGKVYVSCGGDIWWGKREAWLKCIDATQSGDITESGLSWSYPLEKHCCSTPALSDGLVFVADCAGKVHCVDAATGAPCWVHDAEAEIWGSTFVADGKVYVGTRKGHFWVLAAAREKQVLSSIKLDDPVISTCAAANGVLYVGTMSKLYALKEGAKGR
ncbi:MAG: PQQ-binding-like beta-propeller repeat protein [Planctomycetota bacterium]